MIFDTIPDATMRELTREMLESPVPCEVDWHKWHGLLHAPATHMAHFQCGHCDHDASLLLCQSCVSDIYDGAVACKECSEITPLHEGIIFLVPIGGPS